MFVEVERAKITTQVRAAVKSDFPLKDMYGYGGDVLNAGVYGVVVRALNESMKEMKKST